MSVQAEMTRIFSQIVLKLLYPNYADILFAWAALKSYSAKAATPQIFWALERSSETDLALSREYQQSSFEGLIHLEQSNFSSLYSQKSIMPFPHGLFN